jgi:hypothetical protein
MGSTDQREHIAHVRLELAYAASTHGQRGDRR